MIDERGWKQMSFNIAIDGPAGAGKSTIAKNCLLYTSDAADDQ